MHFTTFPLTSTSCTSRRFRSPPHHARCFPSPRHHALHGVSPHNDIVHSRAFRLTSTSLHGFSAHLDITPAGFPRRIDFAIAGLPGRISDFTLAGLRHIRLHDCRLPRRLGLQGCRTFAAFPTHLPRPPAAIKALTSATRSVCCPDIKTTIGFLQYLLLGHFPQHPHPRPAQLLLGRLSPSSISSASPRMTVHRLLQIYSTPTCSTRPYRNCESTDTHISTPKTALLSAQLLLG